MSELDGLKLLRLIEEGVAGKTGEAFFRQIVCDLSRALHAHGAFTSRLLPDRRAGMLAFWSGGQYQACLEYALGGTPCEFVYKGQITAYARNVGDVFPVDRDWFEQMGVQSYLGIPVKDETGAVCGHLAVMDTCERDWAEADVDVLRLFSLRSAAEIERTRYQQELEDANLALRQANERLAQEITNRIAAESQLEASKAVAEGANRAKSVFIGQMSHELRTPLNGILGFAQLLKREGGLSPEKLREGLTIIERSGEHLLKLVNDLLDLAKIEAGKLELSAGYVDLQELLEHVASLARVRAANAGLALDVAVSSDTFVPITADERVLRQVLLNLLGNAMKFTESGGRVGLRAEGWRASEDRQAVRFSVEDTGIGIEESELERIFEPFHRVATQNRVVEGTGLGLTITQRLVAALNGRLSVVSQRGVGSTFTVECEFPVAQEPQTAAFSAARVVGYTGDAKSVLVADDDDSNRILVTRLLEGVGFLVKAVSNGREALDRIKESAPDLVLTDLVMPFFDGMELVRQLQADPALARIPVIAMSASATDYTREEALQAGCSAFVCKPLNLRILLQTVGDHLQVRWQYAVTVPGSVPLQRNKLSQPYRLSPDLAAELQHLVMQGDIVALTERIDAALSADSSAEDFCHEVRKLASRYDLRGIRQILAGSRR
jgi:signal transduction histidine kinase/DNA-binding NarL/FixJ family response regulator